MNQFGDLISILIAADIDNAEADKTFLEIQVIFHFTFYLRCIKLSCNYKKNRIYSNLKIPNFVMNIYLK